MAKAKKRTRKPAEIVDVLDWSGSPLEIPADKGPKIQVPYRREDPMAYRGEIAPEQPTVRPPIGPGMEEEEHGPQPLQENIEAERQELVARLKGARAFKKASTPTTTAPAKTSTVPAQAQTAEEQAEQIVGFEKKPPAPFWEGILAEVIASSLPVALEALSGGKYMGAAYAGGLKASETISKAREKEADREAKKRGLAGFKTYLRKAKNPKTNKEEYMWFTPGDVKTTGVQAVRSQRFIEDPDTGEKFKVDPVSGDQKKMMFGGKDMTFTPNQRKSIRKLRLEARKDPDVKGGIEQMRAAEEALGLLRSDNPIADVAVRTKMARASGDVGNIAVVEQKQYGGSKALRRRVEQYWSEIKSGKLTDLNRRDMIQLSLVFRNYAKARIDRGMGDFVKSESTLWDMPQEKVISGMVFPELAGDEGADTLREAEKEVERIKARRKPEESTGEPKDPMEMDEMPEMREQDGNVFYYDKTNDEWIFYKEAE